MNTIKIPTSRPEGQSKMNMTIQELTAMSEEERFVCFAEWLAAQPPATEYRFQNNGDCILCRFGRSMLGVTTHAGGDYIRTDGKPHRSNESNVIKIVPEYKLIASNSTYAGTFAAIAAAKRILNRHALAT